MKLDVLILFKSYWLIPWSFISAQNLSNPKANADAQQVYEVLTNFQATSEYCIMLGQNLGWSMEEFDNLIGDLQRETGEWPGIIGGQLRFAPDEIDYSSLAQLIINWQAAGGMVELSTLFDNPFTGGDIWDVSVTDIGSLLIPGSDPYNNWRKELDFYAGFLKQLEQAGVTILWRPLMEMNGDWFWYGFQGNDDAQPFINLYRDIYTYYTDKWELNNLIWVYCANIAYSGIPGPDHYYPGDDVVDIVGFDMYLTNLANPRAQYESMIALGKPFAIPEFGPSLDEMDGSHDYGNYVDIMQRDFPQTTYTLAWHSWPDHAAAWINNQNYTTAFNKDCILNRDEIPTLFTTSGAIEKPASSIHIYPNPISVHACISIESELPIEEIQLIDLRGKARPLKFRYGQDGTTIILEPLAEAGIYFLQINNTSGWIVRRLVGH